METSSRAQRFISGAQGGGHTLKLRVKKMTREIEKEKGKAELFYTDS